MHYKLNSFAKHDRAIRKSQTVEKCVPFNQMVELIGARKGAKLAKFRKFFAPLRALREFTVLLTNTKFVKKE